MYNFELIDAEKLNIDEYNSFEDKLIFQMVEWIDFLKETQNIKPVIIRIIKDDEFIGYFTGFFFKKFGLKIVASPFRGWTTSYGGFNLKNSVSRIDVVKPLWNFMKSSLGCEYCEIVDRYITENSVKDAGLKYILQYSYGIDVRGTEEEVLSRFTKHCRKHIRQAEKKGDLTIQKVNPDDTFAVEYYEQLVKVFGYQGLTPSYDLKRVKALLHDIDSEKILCQRAVLSDGTCVGTNISFGYGKRFYTWGSTSLRGEGMDHLQSELLRWEAIKYWKSKGAYDYDMIGIRDYKKKFNPYLIETPRIMLSKYPFLIQARNAAQKIYWVINKIKSK